ncbi:acyltransferase family protein [Peribacillus glennii]|uniref:Acyltransferase n=1 Tax=Peribacillus glennii TaxID=2303991 RepID=A0A372LGA0_9BACI|nr:acyltransferase [Peribacillus glennii]RFU65024.1 acyltransferase [Peribacillus glennii]
MERNTTIDFIKFFAIFAVVVIHVFPRDHHIGLFVLDNFSRFAVPFFFTASGYLFGKKIIYTGDSLDYFNKYLVKMIKLYVSWLFFYIIFDFLNVYKESADLEKAMEQYWNHFSFLDLTYYGSGTSGYQLWFLSALIWSVIILFAFFKLQKVKFLLIVSLVLHLIGLCGQSYSVFFDFPYITRDALFFGLFYTSLGSCFAFDKTFKKARLFTAKTYLSLIVFFFNIQAAEGYILEKILSGRHGEYFLSTIFLTFFLFLFALNNPSLGEGLFTAKIGARAVGIYIVHVFFIDIFDMILSELNKDEIADNLLLKLFKTFVIFSISYAAYDLLQYVKRRIRGRRLSKPVS